MRKLKLWIRKWLELDDQCFDPERLFGQCEAACPISGPIPYMTCGKRTNIKTKGYWHCSDHPPKDTTLPKGERAA